MKATLLKHLALLKVSGKDAASFLQGQLTQNVFWNENTARQALYCNKEGRVRANLMVFKKESDFYLILADDLKEKIIQDLKKYILRSAVKIEIENQKLWGVFENQLKPFLHIQNNQIALFEQGAISIGGEYENEENLFSFWQFLEIKNGLPWITFKNTELFTPQMLNMEQSAVDFHKGCYLGQEVIARTHYLGKTKRALFLLKAQEPVQNGELVFNCAQEKIGTILYSVWHENAGLMQAVLNENAQHPFYNENHILLEVFK